MTYNQQPYAYGVFPTGVNMPAPYPYQPPNAAQRYEVIRVNGENGARAFQMAPNSSVLLLDETAPVVWLVQSDGAGYRTVSPYNITPLQTKEQQDAGKYDSLEARITKLEEAINGKQSYSRSAQSGTNGGRAGKSGTD